MPEYELIKVIGQGGMGSVYEGRSGDGKRVAIKMMNSKATMNPEFKELFYIEAAALKKMRHPSVVGIVDNPFSDEHGICRRRDHRTPCGNGRTLYGIYCKGLDGENSGCNGLYT